ncbi:ArnT family glycosyltransferase [Aerosticca soli]|nr:glycosyltransferase family 39 protein [Aerosticca soli]
MSLPTLPRPSRISLLIAGLFVFAWLVRWYYVSQAMVLHPVRGDAVDYFNYAQNLWRHHVFSKASPDTPMVLGDSFRDPGYPIFLALGMAFFQSWDHWYAAVLLGQALLGALTVLLLLVTARRWLPTPWLGAAGLLMALWPHSVTMTGYLLTETLFGFLCALALWLSVLAIERRSLTLSAGAGIGCALGALTNATLIPFAPCLAIYLWLRRLASGRMACALVLGFAVLYMPWLIRNANLPAAQSSSHDRALMNLVQGSWPEYHASYRAALLGDSTAITISSAINSEYALLHDQPREGWHAWANRLRSQPWRTLTWYVSKPALLWGWDIRIGQGDVYVYPTAASPFHTNLAGRIVIALCHAMNPWLGLLALIGCIIVLCRPSASGTEQPLALLLVMMTAIYTLLQAEPRYSVPLRGEEMVAAMLCLHGIVACLSRRRGIPAA